MAARPLAQARLETLIARGRAALAAFAVAALWLHPARGSGLELALTLSLVYLAYALVLLLLVATRAVNSPRWPAATHAMDLAMLASFLFAARGDTAPPLIAWFAFTLVAATLRWGWRGAITTGSLGLALFVAFGLPHGAARRAPGAAAEYVTTILLLAVLILLVGLVGAYEDWRGRQLAQLASWSAPDPAQPLAVASELLSQAAVVLEVPRTMLVWEESDEPWTELALWQDGQVQRFREPPGTFGEIVPPAVAESSFFCRDADAAKPVTYFHGPRGLQQWSGVPLDPRLRERFAISALAGWPLRESEFRGWLFCLDRPAFSEQDLVMGEVVADLASAWLEQAFLVQRLRDTAVTSERLRLARDLHDGVLQTLTGAALQVQTARRLLALDPAAVEERLSQVQRAISTGQNDLRSFINQLGPQSSDSRGGPIDLTGRVSELADRIRRQWGVPLTVRTEPASLDIPDRMVHDLYLLIHEALVNAARHAQANSIQLAILRGPGQLSISVVDDGQGFPFAGVFSLQDLAERNLGPRSLRERVAALEGSMVLETSPRGTRVRMSVPLQQETV